VVLGLLLLLDDDELLLYGLLDVGLLLEELLPLPDGLVVVRCLFLSTSTFPSAF
jgi:hypothetical protein